MKIVYNLFEAVSTGGIERIVLSKANWLANHGHEVTIITTDRKGREPFFHIDEKIQCIDLGVNYRDDWTSTLRKLIMRPYKMRLHQKRLSKVLDKIKPDISISTFSNELEFLYKLPSAGKCIVEIHFSKHFRLKSRHHGLQGLADKIHSRMDSKLVKKYDAFVCLTHADMELWDNDTNIHSIHNFIPYRLPKRASLESNHAIAVGRLEYEKSFDRLIDSWSLVAKRHPDWILDIYGEGSNHDSLIKQIEQLGLEGKVIIHPITGNIEEIMSQSSMLIMSSHYEGLPMVMLEAISCGLPVVTFDFQCGPRDVLTNGSGIIVKDGDIVGLSEAVCQLIEDKKKRLEMGVAAYERAKGFLPECIMPQWVELFQTLTSGEGK